MPVWKWGKLAKGGSKGYGDGPKVCEIVDPGTGQMKRTLAGCSESMLLPGGRPSRWCCR